MNNTYFEKTVNIAAKDTKKGARVVAKVFYRILRKKGFSDNQIIDIATNILNCLIDSLKGYEKKMENAKEHRSDTGNDHMSGEEVRTITKFRRKFNDHKHVQFNAHV